MGHFAAITALHIGDLNTAQRYCEERLAYSPEDRLPSGVAGRSIAKWPLTAGPGVIVRSWQDAKKKSRLTALPTSLPAKLSPT